ncbi:MAG TPA: biotin transporter BioY [Acidimicrobiales bacterium]
MPRATVVLSDRIHLPTSERTRALLLVAAGALLTALSAQISFVLPWTPVPVTGQTFAVLVVGASLGWRLGAGSQLLYVALGLTGLPVYADGTGGWAVATGSTAGYLVGFILTAALVGAMAERHQDRSLLTSVPAMLTGSALIYLCGATWLSIHLGVSASEAVELGVAPFLIGDALKIVAAGAGLPLIWSRLKR